MERTLSPSPFSRNNFAMCVCKTGGNFSLILTQSFPQSFVLASSVTPQDYATLFSKISLVQ